MGFLTYLIGLSGLAGAIILYCLEIKSSLNQNNSYILCRRPLPVRTLVCGQNSNFTSSNLLFVNGNSLTDMIDLTFHLPDLGGLQVQHLQEVVCQSVDLVRHAGQTLGCVAFGFFKGCSLVITLRRI